MAEYIGTRVVIPGQSRGYGVLKYIGPIEGKNGTFGGVELLGPVAASRGKNSGAVDGVQYFEVSQPMTGLFLPWDRLRAVNSKLPILDEGSRTASMSSRNSEVLQTPSPPTRHGLRMSSMGRADSLSRPTSSGRESPYWKSLTVSTPQRDKRESLAPREFNGAGDDLHLHAEIAALRHQLSEARLALDASTKELHLKSQILVELQHTVNELNPILEDYETSLGEKDRRIKKQKQEYERAREEWRQSLDLMLNGQQQAENLYEQQIEDLKEELAALASQGAGPPGSDTALGELRTQLEELLAENAELKKLLNESGAAGDDEGDEDLISSLRVKVERLTQDVTSMEIVLEDAQKNNRAKDGRIAELEIELEQLKEENVAHLLLGVDSLTVEDWTAQEAELKKKIAELEEQVAVHSAKTKEIQAEKHSDLLGKISLLESDLKTNTYLVESQSQKIEELEKEIQDSVTREEDLRNEVKAVDESLGHSDMLKTIEDLKHELNMRPSFEELSELQTSLEDVERLHRNEIYLKVKEVASLEEANKKLLEEKKSLNKKIEDLGSAISTTPLHQSPAKKENFPPTVSLPEPDSWAKADGLPIFTPPNPVDPSSGRSEWCGLCERDGHNSLNCPYENDIF